MTQEKQQNDAITIRDDIQALIDEIYDYGIDIDENGNPDILMSTVTELTRLRHKVTTELERAQRMDAQIHKLADFIISLECGHPRHDDGGAVDTAIRYIKELRDVPTIKPQYGEWLDIESALKNTEPPILGYNPSWDSPKLICFNETYTLEMCWHEYDGMPLATTPHSQPTHWMPLPDLPDAPKEGDDDTRNDG